MIRDKQLRVVYSLLKPAMRMAARFNVPVRSLVELVRLAYYEVLRAEGLSQAEIAARFGQSTRHMRSLARRHGEDFFRAEHEVGLVRRIEDLVATKHPKEAELPALVEDVSEEELAAATEALIAEGRVLRQSGGRLEIGTPYVVMASDQFHHRIDALNHHLEALSRAVLQRLIWNRTGTALIKTISFSTSRAALEAYLRRLEGELRRELAALEENAAFSGEERGRFTLGLHVAEDDPGKT